MICDLCRNEFDAACASGCSGCWKASRCRGIRCPYCLYEILPRVAWWEAFCRQMRRFVGRRAA